MSDTDTAELERFARKGMEAQSAVDRLTQQPLMLDLNPMASGAMAMALKKKREAMEAARQAEALTKKAREMRDLRNKLEAEASELMEKAVVDQDTPPLPFDPAAQHVAEKMLAPPGAPPPVDLNKELRAVGAQPFEPLPVNQQVSAEPIPAAVSLPVLPPHTDAEAQGLMGLAMKIQAGEVVMAADLHISPQQLNLCLRRTQVFPAAPDFKPAGTGLISPIQVGDEDFAVVMCRMASPGGIRTATYVLHPIYPEDHWELPIQTPMQRFSKHSEPPEEIPMKGVRVQTWGNDGQSWWVLGEDDQRIFVQTNADEQYGDDMPRGAVQKPFAERAVDDAIAEGKQLAQLDDAIAQNVEVWYVAAAAERGIDAPNLSTARVNTIRELVEKREELGNIAHLMLDPRVNEYGVATNPDRIHVHTLPKTIGTATIKVFEDLEGMWWGAHEFQFKLAELGGSTSPTSVHGKRFESKLACVHAELDIMHAWADGRPAHSKNQEGALRRWLDAVREFRREMEQKVRESTGRSIKHTPSRAKRSIAAGHTPDSPAAWFIHFNETYKSLSGGHSAPPPDRADGHPLSYEVADLYERYRAGRLQPSDAAREYWRDNGARGSVGARGTVQRRLATAGTKRVSKPKAKKKASLCELHTNISLGSFCGGLRQALKRDGMSNMIDYVPATKTSEASAADDVVSCWRSGFSVTQTAAHLREAWRDRRKR